MTRGDDLTEVRRRLARFQRVAHVPLAFGGMVVDGKNLHISELFGTSTNALSGLVVGLGRGLGGRVLALSRPTAVSNYQQATLISHDYDRPVRDEGVCSAIAVPVTVRRVVRAVMYGASREAAPLGDWAINAAVDAAKDLEQDLVVRDEVDRRIALLTEHMDTRNGPAGADPEPELREAVRAAHAELRMIAAQTDDEHIRARVHQACAALTRSPNGQAPTVSLAPRELDVLSWVALGHTNAEIAAELGLLPETVKSYLRSAMRKLGRTTRFQAVVAARQAGLLP